PSPCVLLPCPLLIHVPIPAFLFSFSSSRPPPAPPSFPTRRSSDLRHHRRDRPPGQPPRAQRGRAAAEPVPHRLLPHGARHPRAQDRKSTRLNSSHVSISYAVFCLKKKKKKTNRHNEH